jgi:hypothetical protein
MLLRYFLIGLVYCSITTSFSQSNTVSSGGNATGSNGNVSYSVGQIDYTVQSTAGGNIIQGVQQPYELFEMNAINEMELSFDLSIAPNPVSDLLIINAANLPDGEFFIELFDLNGKLIIEKAKLQESQLFNLSDVAIGTYHLVVSNSNSIIKTYKILKNN